MQRPRAPQVVAWIAVLAGIALLLAPLRSVRGAERSPPPFVVIVNPANPSTSLDRKFVADAFLKKVTRWPQGDVIRPVDLSADSPTRMRFSEDVLNRSVSAVKSYWQQIIFSGRDVPPPELANDDEVLKFVTKTPTALGYVSGTARLEGVRPVKIE